MFVKSVNTKKNLNCINLQLAIRISKNRSFEKLRYAFPVPRYLCEIWDQSIC